MDSKPNSHNLICRNRVQLWRRTNSAFSRRPRPQTTTPAPWCQPRPWTDSQEQGRVARCLDAKFQGSHLVVEWAALIWALSGPVSVGASRLWPYNFGLIQIVEHPKLSQNLNQLIQVVEPIESCI